MKIVSLLFCGVLAMSVLQGCTKYPDQFDEDKEKDISLTYYDNTADFSEYATYAIVDTVGQVTSDGDSLVVVPYENSDMILTQMRQNLTDYGLVEVDTSANPDLLINAHVLALDVEYEYYYGGYWDYGYYYSYDPYYYGSPYYWGYGGYSYYYPYAYSYTYSSTYGTLLMECLDNKNRNNTTEQIKTVWSGLVVGTVNSTYGIQERIRNGIDECFEQSLYLND